MGGRERVRRKVPPSNCGPKLSMNTGTVSGYLVFSPILSPIPSGGWAACAPSDTFSEFREARRIIRAMLTWRRQF